jgi:drug/metabolite transporter (DMT)-like permease
MSSSIFSTYGAILAVGMIVTGSLNTISTKAADLQVSLNRYNELALFSHPFVQAWGMFSGEFLCLIVYTFLSMRATSKGDDSFPRAKPHSKFIYLVPAMCDMLGTSIMYLGLSLTSSSVFQMLRGSVVIFTAVFSVVFLKRTVKPYQWLGVCLVLVGTITVGLQSYVPSCKSGDGGSNTTDARAMTGNILIILAQIIVATQMVVEEKFLSAYDVPPLQVVGWEGLWGLTILSGVLGIMYVVPTKGTPMCSPNLYGNGTEIKGDDVCNHVEDTYDALVQFNNNKLIILFTVLNLFSIAFFNFFGVVSITAVCLFICLPSLLRLFSVSTVPSHRRFPLSTFLFTTQSSAHAQCNRV